MGSGSGSPSAAVSRVVEQIGAESVCSKATTVLDGIWPSSRVVSRSTLDRAQLRLPRSEVRLRRVAFTRVTRQCRGVPDHDGLTC
jgi:hypothetical protein